MRFPAWTIQPVDANPPEVYEVAVGLDTDALIRADVILSAGVLYIANAQD
jgi:hypothetical protein